MDPNVNLSLNYIGIIQILRTHQGGGGFRNDYANVIFALSGGCLTSLFVLSLLAYHGGKGREMGDKKGQKS